MNINGIKPIGVGIGYRKQFHKDILQYKDKIDFLEIIADGYMYDTGLLKELDILYKHFPLVFHAVNLSLGGTCVINQEYLEEYEYLGRRYKSPWLSEHVATTRHGDISFGHLTPVPFNAEAAHVIVKNHALVEDYIDKPVILENISYDFVMPTSTMREEQFFNYISKISKCGFLLDVTNIYNNAINHDYNPFKFIDNFPLDKVVQLHFTGGNWNGEMYVDSHSSETPEHVWELIEYVLKKTPVKGLILERDDPEAELKDLIPELERAKELWLKYNQ